MAPPRRYECRGRLLFGGRARGSGISARVQSTLVAVAAALGLAIAIAVGSSHGSTQPVGVFPSAGTPVASPSTQISFRGADPDELTAISVVGSRTGNHGGHLAAHSDGNGASFLPTRPFRAGERVSVRAAVPLVGARNGTVTFTIANPPLNAQRGHVQGDPGGIPRAAQRFRSRPDLMPPTIAVTTRSASAAAGDLFVAAKAGPGQDGPIIADEAGRPLWFHRVPRGTSAFDFRVQEYRGSPVLTWWQGKVLHGQGLGDGLIYDSSYRQLARVRAGNGYHADFHEFQLTPQGTALMLAYQPVRWDLRSVGGPRNGVAMDTLVQEIDVKTGLVLFEWHSLGHVPLGDSYAGRGSQPFDLTHLNSVEEETNGNLLLSARNTNALYEVDRRSGAILWRLGGKHSDFKMSGGSRFVSQHTTHLLPDDSITVFDNGSPPFPGRPARGLVLKADMGSRAVSIEHVFRYPRSLHSPSQGSVQSLPNGDFLVGWGANNPYVTEFAPNGRIVFDSHFAPSDDTYRAYRLPWTGHPADSPSVAAVSSGGKTQVFASWNGATEVASWQVLAGATPGSLKPVSTVARNGFETRVQLAAAAPYVAVRALGASGHALGTSKTIAPH